MKKMFFVAFVLLCAASVSYANTCEEKCAADHENVLEVVKCIGKCTYIEEHKPAPLNREYNEPMIKAK